MASKFFRPVFFDLPKNTTVALFAIKKNNSMERSTGSYLVQEESISASATILSNKIILINTQHLYLIYSCLILLIFIAGCIVLNFVKSSRARVKHFYLFILQF